MAPKNTICIWYDDGALDAAQFYARTFPDSSVGGVHRAPGDFPSGKQGQVLTVQFTVLGIPCLGLNGGPAVKQSEAFSFQVSTVDQAETDRYWNAIVGNGGKESACGWCKDKWGLSWQITPRALTQAMAQGGEVAKRAFTAMMGTSNVVWAVNGSCVTGSSIISILPWSAVTSITPPIFSMAARRVPKAPSMVVTASLAAAITPVWPTMSGLA